MACRCAGINGMQARRQSLASRAAPAIPPAVESQPKEHMLVRIPRLAAVTRRPPLTDSAVVQVLPVTNTEEISCPRNDCVRPSSAALLLKV
jgi:hypothetical protein